MPNYSSEEFNRNIVYLEDKNYVVKEQNGGWRITAKGTDYIEQKIAEEKERKRNQEKKGRLGF